MGALADAFRNAFNWVSLPKFGVSDVIEILLIAFLIYHLIKGLQGFHRASLLLTSAKTWLFLWGKWGDFSTP